MRLCPTVEGSPSSLIIHRIGADVCQARQEAFFHKCHRCIYRGKPAEWKPEEPPHLEIELEGAGGRGGRASSPPRRVAAAVAPGQAPSEVVPGKTGPTKKGTTKKGTGKKGTGKPAPRRAVPGKVAESEA